MSTIHEKVAEEARALEAAKKAYEDRVKEIQKDCKHSVVLKFTDMNHLTTRICEECGYYERVQWDSVFGYKDKNLIGRAYIVSRSEILKAMP